MRALLVAIAILVGGGVARAQPWAEGVAEVQKEEARRLLDEGNVLFLDKNYKEALAKYETALKSWDHPAIRFNIVRCLIQLDRPVEAFDNLQLALAYGAAPHEETIYNEALNYQKLLAGQIAELEVSCTQAGAKVTLDGQPLLTCPGTEKRRLAPGHHGIVATKHGFLTKQVDVVIVGGKREVVDITLVPLETTAKVVHRWPGWIPWVVFGSSLAVTGVGALVQYNASRTMTDYNAEVGRTCQGGGCDFDNPPLGQEEHYAALADKRESAELQNKIAIGVIATGAAGVIVGGVMLYMNRGRTVYEKPRQTAPVAVVPTADGGGMVTLSASF